MVCGGGDEVSPAVDPAGTPQVPPACGVTLKGTCQKLPICVINQRGVNNKLWFLMQNLSIQQKKGDIDKGVNDMGGDHLSRSLTTQNKQQQREFFVVRLGGI